MKCQNLFLPLLVIFVPSLLNFVDHLILKMLLQLILYTLIED